MKAARRVGVVGPFPPPVHGAAEVTRRIADALGAHVEVERLPISPGAGVAGIAHHASRLFRVLAAARALANERGPVYLSAAGGFGLGYNVLLAAVARVFGRALFIHHHSFAYIDRSDRLAALLVRAAGRSAAHICLCSRMAEGLATRYGRVRTVIVSNGAFCPPEPDRVELPTSRFRIGHLGNLSRDKGLDLVLELASTLIARGAAVELVLAGPPSDSAARELIDGARQQLGNRLVELGPLYGDEKRRFFQTIDVFVFPTKYANEAEPLVIFEALADGVPVIAFARGCIRETIGNGGAAIEPDGDFVTRASEAIAAWLEQPDRLKEVRERAKERSRALHEIGKSQLGRLLESLCAAVQ